MDEMTFEQFKADCLRACHERHSCEEGLRGVVNAENTLQLLAVVKTFWKDVYESKYYDIVAERLQQWYALREEFNRQGIYVNEPTERGIVMVNNYEGEFRCGGEADIYVFGRSDVIAGGTATVHCRTAGSHIILLDSARGYIEQGCVEIRNYAQAVCNTPEEVHCYGASTVRMQSGRLTDHGHRHIYAFSGSEIVSSNPTGITLYDDARIIEPSEDK